MVVIFDSVDAIGKDTQIEKLVQEAHKRGIITHILHYSNIKGLKDNNAVRDLSVKQYQSIFTFMKDVAIPSKDLFIYNRAHLSEYVYSPMYRNYDGYYVFALEKTILKDSLSKDIYLFSFTDNPEKIIERDKERGDGQSFSLDLDKKKQELDMFKEAYNLSSIYRKNLINIENKSIDDVADEINQTVFGGIYW
jgi:thymidylate kinase